MSSTERKDNGSSTLVPIDSQSGAFRDHILSMVYGFADAPSSGAGDIVQFEVVVEERNPHFERKVSTHDSQDTMTPGPHMLIGQLEAGSLLGKARGLEFVSSQMRSCYYSSIKTEKDSTILETWYNLKENHTVDPINLLVNLRASLEREHEPVYFSYNLSTGQSTYLLSKATLPDLSTLTRTNLPRLHPFTIHIALLSGEITTRMRPMVETLDKMLEIEKRLLEDALPANLSTTMLKSDLRGLHAISRLLIVCEHRTGRDLLNIDSLLRDLDRLEKETKRHPEYFALDANIHERVKDGLLSLRDACVNIDRRLENRKLRVQNLIALLYNLMQNQDSHTLLTDSAAMKTIATLTMLFLPATFISGLFGTNFFALVAKTGGSGAGADLIVSDQWWIFLACCLPLTAAVFAVWQGWMVGRRAWKRRRGRVVVGKGRGVEERERREREEEGVV
ncbi:hypothetical protein MMC30_009295 [Trapelia coarctata]|nr:hypothetical protein [Trapelia coarctata]